METQIRRYLPHLLAAFRSSPDPHSFHRGDWALSTHINQLRACINFLRQHPYRCGPDNNTPEFIAFLSKVRVRHDHISTVSLALTFSEKDLPPPTIATLNEISIPLSQDALHALFYCYNQGLLSFPTRILNPSSEMLLFIRGYAASCPNVAIDIQPTCVTIL